LNADGHGIMICVADLDWEVAVLKDVKRWEKDVIFLCGGNMKRKISSESKQVDFLSNHPGWGYA